MGVKIDKILVKDLGPIKDFSAKLGLFNIIYSRNEKGKTFLTEFIIRSLFRNVKRWRLREGGSGKVIVSGVEKDSIEFSLSSKKKLEDYWEKDERGLPPSMANLLVVKGGEAEIEGTEEGVSKFLIKEVLSGINILDKIDADNNISKTIKSAQLSNDLISINKQGEGKHYFKIKDELEGINKLSENIESQYTQGVLKTYKIEEELLRKQSEECERAKRYEAHLTSEKISTLEMKLNKIPEDALYQMEADLTLSISKIDDYNKLKADYADARNKSKDFNWLQNVVIIYKELTEQIIEKPKTNLLIIGGILIAIAIGLVLLGPKFIGIIFLLGSLVPIGVYIKKLHNSSKYIGQSEELYKIKAIFKTRIGKELTDLALLQTVLKEQEEYNSKSEVLKGQLEDRDRELRKLHSSIRQKLFTLIGRDIEESQWNPTLRNLKQKNETFKKQIADQKEKLHKLGIDETDYLKEEIRIKYSQEEHKKIESKLKDVQEKIVNQEKQLENLKYQVSQQTKKDPTLSWEQLIEDLRQKREGVENELKDITSKIVAGISVHNVIFRLRKEEDTKIQERLKSDTVLIPLRELTQRYNKLTLEGEKLIVSDDYNDFDLKDLSTGAREQIMLALRLGFSSKLLKQDTTFLILDDAIQHCDWEKRKLMVDQLTAIAENGWQVIYLTMDDHIRDLFMEKQKVFGDKSFVYEEIGTSRP